MSKSKRIALFLFAAAISSLFYLDFCNFVYNCGCRSWWAGADQHCNIHNPHSRHCPWCDIGLPGSIAVWALIVASQGAIAFSSVSLSALPRTVLTLAAFPAVGGILALAVGFYKGYWN